MSDQQGQTLEELAKGGWSEAAPAAPPASPASLGARAGVPAAGRGTQLDLGKSQEGAAAVADTATGPLLNSGHPVIDSMTSPLALGSLAFAGTAIGRAVGATGLTAAQRALAALEAAGGPVTAIAKYDLSRRAMHAVGVPEWLAVPAAIMISGYKAGGKGAATAAEESAATGPHLDRSVPVQPSALTADELKARILSGTGTPPPSAPKLKIVPRPAPEVVETPPADVPAIRMGPDGRLVGRPGGNPDLPDQNALNEAALARRRAEYQAHQAAETVTEPAVKPTMTAAEAGEYLKLRAAGKTDEQARAVLQFSRRAGVMTDAEAAAAIKKRNYKS